MISRAHNMLLCQFDCQRKIFFQKRIKNFCVPQNITISFLLTHRFGRPCLFRIWRAATLVFNQTYHALHIFIRAFLNE